MTETLMDATFLEKAEGVKVGQPLDVSKFYVAAHALRFDGGVEYLVLTGDAHYLVAVREPRNTSATLLQAFAYDYNATETEDRLYEKVLGAMMSAALGK